MIIGLGNSNNLIWMMLRSIKKTNPDIECILVRIDKQKLRDIPINLEGGELTDIIVKHYHEILGMVGKQNFPRTSKLLFLVSGEFFASLPLLRELCPQAIFVAVVIGFEFEGIIFSRQRELTSEFNEFAKQVEDGILLCHYLIQADSAPNPIRSFLSNNGLWSRRLKCAMKLNPFRTGLVSDIISSRRPKFNQLINKYKDLRRVIVAARITDINSAALGNKGSIPLLEKFASMSKKKMMTDTLVSLIVRDQVSYKYSCALEDAVKGSSNRVERLPELAYDDFILHLATSGLVIDVYGSSENMKPHMTTSDSIAVGAPIVTAVNEKNGISIFDNPCLNVFSEGAINQVDSIDFDPNFGTRQEKRRSLLESEFYRYTESFESEEITSLYFQQ